MLNTGNRRGGRGAHRAKGGYRSIALFTVIALMLTMFSFNSLIFADDLITTEGAAGAGPDVTAEGDIIVELPDVSAPEATADASGQKYDPKLPKAAMPAGWALLDLLLTIATGSIMLLLIITYFVNRKDDEDTGYEADAQGHLGFRIMTVVTTAVAVILFILTENMRIQMILTDKYTLWYIVITVITIIFAILSIKKYERESLNAK